MHSFNKLLIGTSIAMLGGCILAYDYNKHDGSGAGGSGGENAGGTGGSSIAAGGDGGASASSTSSSGMGGAGGGPVSCPITICNDPDYSCEQGQCPANKWAYRFGDTGNRQLATAVAINTSGTVFTAGVYDETGFSFIGPNVTTLLPANPGTNGFVSAFDADGNPVWAKEIDAWGKVDVKSAAINVQNDVIVAGTMQTSTNTFEMLLAKVTGLGVTHHATFFNSIGTVEASAVAVDGVSIYVVGRSFQNVDPIPCEFPSMAKLVTGMFVMKFNNALACQWVQTFNVGTVNEVRPADIAARMSSTHGVWITGSFTNTMGIGSQSNLTPRVIGTSDMFLIQLADADGMPLKSIAFNKNADQVGSLEPASIDTNGTDTVYVAGQLKGKTAFRPDLVGSSQTAGFVAAINSSTLMANAVVFPGSTGAGEGARATSVAYDSGELYVAGTFSGTMFVDPPNLPVMSYGSGNNGFSSPFLTVLDVSTMPPVVSHFDAFPGRDEPFDTNTVFLAATANSIAFAGGWTHNLDLSTAGHPAYLPAPSTANADIFVAGFGPP